MSYFTAFPKTSYEVDGEVIFATDLTAYAEVLDSVRLSSSFYQDYFIQHAERPDHVAFKFYSDPQLHWVMYLMNPKLREQGWPMDTTELMTKVKRDHPDTTLIIRDVSITTELSVGQVIKGYSSEAVGTIVHKNVDLGQVTVKTTGTFVVGELLRDVASGDTYGQWSEIDEVVPEYLAAHEYRVNGEHVDINPYETIPTAPVHTKVTIKDLYFENNDKLKQIRIVKPSAINQVVGAFKQAIQS